MRFQAKPPLKYPCTPRTAQHLAEHSNVIESRGLGIYPF